MCPVAHTTHTHCVCVCLHHLTGRIPLRVGVGPALGWAQRRCLEDLPSDEWMSTWVGAWDPQSPQMSGKQGEVSVSGTRGSCQERGKADLTHVAFLEASPFSFLLPCGERGPEAAGCRPRGDLAHNEQGGGGLQAAALWTGPTGC